MVCLCVRRRDMVDKAFGLWKLLPKEQVCAVFQTPMDWLAAYVYKK